MRALAGLEEHAHSARLHVRRRALVVAL